MPPTVSSDQPRLSIIDEDSALPTSPRPVASHRPFSRRWRDAPPPANSEGSPPMYSVWDVSGPRGEKLMDMRNNKYIVRRGGWKRLCLVFLVVVILALALGVGLGVGLHNKHDESNGGSPSSRNSSSPGTDSFPVGSFSLTTNLDTVSTACTAKSETWSCYPDSTYSMSQTASVATFNWIIVNASSILSISSSDNPFAISFANASLTLLDAGASNERYTFSVQMDKLVVPSSPITDDNHNANCYYNGTTFEAALYTKKTGSNGKITGNATENSASSLGWVNWPYALEVNQTINAGINVPNCYELDNGVPSTPITTGLAAKPTGDQCACVWRNYDL